MSENATRIELYPYVPIETYYKQRSLVILSSLLKSKREGSKEKEDEILRAFQKEFLEIGPMGEGGFDRFFPRLKEQSEKLFGGQIEESWLEEEIKRLIPEIQKEHDESRIRHEAMGVHFPTSVIEDAEKFFLGTAQK